MYQSLRLNKICLSSLEPPSGIVLSSADIRYLLTVTIKNLLQQTGNSIAFNTNSNKELLPNIEKFFNSIQTNNQVYKASLSRQLSAGLSPDVEETTFKDTAKSWFIKTADFGDNYDQLLQHPDGRFTQLLEDIARYHQIFQQGYDKIILLRPSSYTGYDIQLTAAIQCLGYTREQFQFIIVQPIKLYAFHKPSQQLQAIPDLPSNELMQAIGPDALRWHCFNTPFTETAPINISTAGKPTPQNSLYRVQAAHARCCLLLYQAHQEGIIQLDTTGPWQVTSALPSFAESEWNNPDAANLVKLLQSTPQLLQQAADKIALYLLCQHLEKISNSVHSWCSNLAPTFQDYALLLATKQIIFNLLEIILGIKAPDLIKNSALASN